MPFTERAYYPPAAAAAGGSMSVPAPFPAFQFRGRLEAPDWRRLSAVDVERVWREGDVAALQEHLEHVTFCSAERERCPHCQGPADPLLLKLLRLAQLCTEYLLHSQEYLSAQLGSLEEALRTAQAQRDQLDKEAVQRMQEIRGLKEECRRRKKMISTQQMMLEARASYHQCRFCEKAFMSYSFLQSHMQRRHLEESQIEQNRKAKTDKLQDEIDKLKEQLQLAKSQLEAEQQANVVRFSKECEQQNSKEEILQSLHKWKEEEKGKLGDEIEKVKAMFMKELKELSSRNSKLENQLLELQTSNMQQKSNLGTLKDSEEFTDEKPQRLQDHHNVDKIREEEKSKWTSKIQALQLDHKTEKTMLLSQIEKLKSSRRGDKNKNSIFYKRRIEELEQELQERNSVIITQNKQIKELATRSVANVKPCEVNTTVERLEESKPSPPVMHQQAPLVHMLEPIEELSEEEKETEKSDNKAGRSKHYLKDALKTVPSLTKELRVYWEQALEEKLKDLGIKASVRGIPNNRFEDISRAIKSARKCKRKQEPDIQRIREHLERQVSVRVKENLSSCNRPVSCPQLPSEEKQKFRQLEISSSAAPRKPVKRSSTAVRPAEQKTAVNENTSTPKSMGFFGNGVSRRTSSITTLPFSSEEEADEDDSLQPDPPPQLLQKQSKTLSSKVSAFQKASDKRDLDGTEESEAEEAGTPAKTSKGTVIQRLTEQVGKSLSNHGSKNKPAGGINVAQAFIKKEEVKELKFTEADEDDLDISLLEDLLMQDDRGQKSAMVQKNESNSTSVVHAWGLPRTSVAKEEGPHEADNTSTLKSSLVTVTDWSDCSDT